MPSPRDRDEYDDDDDRPRRRDRDDEEPRRRRRDDDDRPRRRRKAKKSGMSGGVIAAIIGGIVLFAFCACGGLFALLLPAVQKTRQAAMRSVDMDNEKRLGIALHNYHDANRAWHAPFARNPATGKNNLGLSFRVGLLPYIEQGSLYSSLDLSQSWESARNKSVTDTVIKDFTSPPDLSTMTPYRTFVGRGAMFDVEGKPVSFSEITDGLSNTILLAHAADKVPWAKPDELMYDPDGPLPKLGEPNADGFTVLLADGSVRYIKKTIDEKTLRALITKSGGEPVQPGDW